MATGAPPWNTSHVLGIRAARLDEVDLLRDIEDDAGRRYGEVGIPEDLEGLERSVVEAAIRDGTTWVATDDDDVPIAFALCWVRGEALHLRELDVRRAHMRNGIGRRLLEHVYERATAKGLSHVTLTTFRDVPWNAPFYARSGFAVLAPEAQPAWLAAIRADEDAGELSRWPRVAMARALR